jgi:hypothetical protein
MKHMKTNLCFLALIIAALGIGMIIQNPNIIEGHGGIGSYGGYGSRSGNRSGNEYLYVNDPYLVGQPIYVKPNYPYYF